MLFSLPICLSLWLATASFISSLEWIFEQHHAPNKVTEALISGILPGHTIDDYNVTKSDGNKLIIMPSTPRSLSMNELMGFVKALKTVNFTNHISFMDSVEEDFLTLRSVPMTVLRDGIDYTVQLPAVTYLPGHYRVPITSSETFNNDQFSTRDVYSTTRNLDLNYLHQNVYSY
ncbi:unnamed protein product [Hanseniaspora opuntiae]